MKKLLLILSIAIISRQGFSQQLIIDQFNLKKNNIDKTGFLVLGSWAAANIIYGSIATSGAEGSNKYFNQMNAIWNGVNLGLAAMGYLGSKREAGLSYEKCLKEQIKMEKVFLANAGIDVAYIAVGFYLQEHSKTVIKNSDKLKGYGESISFQGSGLLIFDVIMYTLHTAHGRQLYKLAEKVKLTSTGNDIGVLVKL